MSGGHYDYVQFNLTLLADNIEGEFKEGGKHQIEDWRESLYSTQSKMIEADYFEGFSDPEREYVLDNIKKLVFDIRSCYNRINILDRFMSGDTGKTALLERWNKND